MLYPLLELCQTSGYVQVRAPFSKEMVRLHDFMLNGKIMPPLAFDDRIYRRPKGASRDVQRS